MTAAYGADDPDPPAGTHAAMVTAYPETGLRQGAEDYLRHVAARRGMDPAFTRPIQDALDRWDALRTPATATG